MSSDFKRLKIKIVLVSFLTAIVLGTTGIYGYQALTVSSQKNSSTEEVNYAPPTGSVLAADSSKKGNITFSVPVFFKDNVSLESDLQVLGSSTFQTLTANTITASNILYSLTAGNGLSITPGQNPTISNSGVLSLGGETGEITLTGDSGISVEGLTIKNTDPGSSQNIFKTIKVGSESFTADSNSDTFTFEAGEGVSLTTDTTNKKVTISNSGAEAAAYESGDGIALNEKTFSIDAPTCTGTDKLTWNGSAFVCSPDDGASYTAGQGITIDENTLSVDVPVCSGTKKLQWSGTAFICVEDNSADSLTVTATQSGMLASFSYNGTSVFSISTNGDLSIGGKITMKEDDTNLANAVDTFIYEVSKDYDGGGWTNSDRVQASSWYNESIDHTGEECNLTEDDRCGRRAFPKRAIITLTDKNILIFDGQENSLWMKFNRGEGFGINSPTTTLSSVYALDGVIYVGTTEAGLLTINFPEDKIYQYDYSHNQGGRAIFQGTIEERNTNKGYGAKAPWGKIASDKVLGVHARIIKGRLYIAVSTLGGVSIINPTDEKVIRYTD